jgi:hypothetical protein
MRVVAVVSAWHPIVGIAVELTIPNDVPQDFVVLDYVADNPHLIDAVFVDIDSVRITIVARIVALANPVLGAGIPSVRAMVALRPTHIQFLE